MPFFSKENTDSHNNTQVHIYLKLQGLILLTVSEESLAFIFYLLIYLTQETQHLDVPL